MQSQLAGCLLYSTVSQAEGNNRGKFSPFGDLKYPKVSKKKAMLPEYLYRAIRIGIDLNMRALMTTLKERSFPALRPMTLGLPVLLDWNAAGVQVSRTLLLKSMLIFWVSVHFYSERPTNIFLVIKISEDEITDAKPNKNKSAVVARHVPGRIRFKLHSQNRDKETMEGIRRNL
jgi:hypothetical protein